MTLSIGVLNDFFKSAGIVWIDSRGNPDNPSPSEPQKDEDRRIFDSNVSEGNSKDQNKKTQTQANPASHSSNPSYSFHSTGFFEAGNRSCTIRDSKILQIRVPLSLLIIHSAWMFQTNGATGSISRKLQCARSLRDSKEGDEAVILTMADRIPNRRVNFSRNLNLILDHPKK